VFFEEFFMQIMTGYSFFGDTPFSQREVGGVTYFLTHGKVWMFVSAGCILVLSLLFLAMAAWKVNPMHSGSGRRKGKMKRGI